LRLVLVSPRLRLVALRLILDPRDRLLVLRLKPIGQLAPPVSKIRRLPVLPEREPFANVEGLDGHSVNAQLVLSHSRMPLFDYFQKSALACGDVTRIDMPTARAPELLESCSTNCLISNIATRCEVLNLGHYPGWFDSGGN
jgi:hypothetical protein